MSVVWLFIGVRELIIIIKAKREAKAEIEKTKAKIAENEAKISAAENKLNAYYAEQKEKYDIYSLYIKALVYDFSLIRNNGVISHMFHYEDKFVYILWQNENGFEVSVHNMTDKKGLYYVNQNTKDIYGKKFLMEIISVLTTFVAKIHLNGQGETNSLNEGTMNGYQSGYVAGYIKGQEDTFNNKWELPDKDERLNELKNVPNKIGNMQK